MIEAKVYKTGDIVQLKSGGPKMTVKLYRPLPEGGSEVTCQWTTDAGAYQEKFPGESLKAAD